MQRGKRLLNVPRESSSIAATDANRNAFHRRGVGHAKPESRTVEVSGGRECFTRRTECQPFCRESRDFFLEDSRIVYGRKDRLLRWGRRIPLLDFEQPLASGRTRWIGGKRSRKRRLRQVRLVQSQMAKPSKACATASEARARQPCGPLRPRFGAACLRQRQNQLVFRDGPIPIAGRQHRCLQAIWRDRGRRVAQRSEGVALDQRW